MVYLLTFWSYLAVLILEIKKPPTNWLGQVKRRASKIRFKVVRGGIDVISGEAVDEVGMDVTVKLGGSVFEIFDSLADRAHLRSFVQYLIACFSLTETTSYVISGNFVGQVMPDKRLECRVLRLNLSPENPPKVVAGGIFAGFSR